MGVEQLLEVGLGVGEERGMQSFGGRQRCRRMDVCGDGCGQPVRNV